MNAEIQIFENDQFGMIRTVVVNDSPYFVASDVAKSLGYEKPSNAVSMHCKRALKQGISDNQGVPHDYNVIPESDVYRLIMRSQLPTAEKFQDWVFDEVLPSIRKTGGYVAASENDTPELIIARALVVAKETIDRVQKEKEQLRAQTVDQEKQIESQRPAVVFHESVSASDTVITVGDLAKLICQNGIEIGEHRLYQWLVENKYLICRKRWSKTKNRYDNDYMPYQKYVEMGLFFVTENVIQGAKEPFVKHTVKITGKGQPYFINKFLLEKAA